MGWLDKKAVQARARGVLDPVVGRLAYWGVSPFFVSFVGLAVGLFGAWVLGHGALFWSGILLLIAGVADIIDGGLARRRRVESPFGAFVDSTFDRISELAYLFALIFYYIQRPHGYSLNDIALVCVVIAGSILTSYTRARVEGLGHTCTVGIMERPERLALLVLGLLLGRHVLPLTLFAIAAGSTITVLQRIRRAWIVTRERPSQTPAG